uniref:ATP synthase complex subunit 8 n=1 Tax=Nephus voeltzkowi TaxID=2233631 RepID=A0A6M3WFG7_9CUCU|nr:ATP synthase F0 subunit 8 [Nephus voeltzkowi]QJF72928.1 ATP synthase F0 subunit 8 [Nephus voeltzkowi]
MPQMMPLNWMMLFLYFLLIFYLFNINLYFNNNIKKKDIPSKKYKFKLNWKW